MKLIFLVFSWPAVSMEICFLVCLVCFGLFSVCTFVCQHCWTVGYPPSVHDRFNDLVWSLPFFLSDACVLCFVFSARSYKKDRQDCYRSDARQSSGRKCQQRSIDAIFHDDHGSMTDLKSTMNQAPQCGISSMESRILPEQSYKCCVRRCSVLAFSSFWPNWITKRGIDRLWGVCSLFGGIYGGEEGERELRAMIYCVGTIIVMTDICCHDCSPVRLGGSFSTIVASFGYWYCFSLSLWWDTVGVSVRLIKVVTKMQQVSYRNTPE